MNSLILGTFLALLSCSFFITKTSAFRPRNSRRSQIFTALDASARAIAPTPAEFDLAYQYWMDQHAGIPTTAQAYLTKEACQVKVQNLVTALNNVNGALEMLKNDPGVLRFKDETVSGSYAAWVRKFDGDETKALELCIRAPMILALKSKVVDEIKESDVAQTIFFSYFAVAFRIPTKFIQSLIKPLFNL